MRVSKQTKHIITLLVLGILASPMASLIYHVLTVHPKRKPKRNVYKSVRTTS